MRFLSALAALLLFTTSAKASVSFVLAADLLKDANGTPAPASTLVMLVVSTADSVFSPLIPGSYPVGSHISEDDVVLFLTDLSSSGIPGVLDAGTPGLFLESIPGWTVGDPLALYWITGASLEQQQIESLDPFGMYTDSVGHDGSDPWVTPADGTPGWNLWMYTQDGQDYSPGAGASNPASAGIASSVATAVPEPGRAVLFVLGMLIMVLNRTRPRYGRQPFNRMP